MNIDKQDERLLHEILSKYKQGLISGLIQGNNVTFTSTGCRNKVISSTGGGTSSLFPKGYEFISESRDFLPTDEGKLLVLAAGVTITMPSEFPFLANQIVGVNTLDSNCYYQDKAGSTVQIFGINNQPNEVVVLLSEPDFNSLLPISSSVIEGKTMLKYLYDKLQNAIPLSGTEVGSPVTGDIEIADDIKIKSVDVSATDGYLKFRTGQFEQKTTDNIGLTNSEIRSSGTSAFFRVTDNNTGFSNQISVSNLGIDVNSTDPLSRGLSAIQDFSPNITDLDYTQKIYVGFRGTATLSSGTVTVTTDKIKTGYKIYVSVNTPSGTQGFLSAPTGSIVNETEFVINSTSATDDSTVNWWIAP